MHLLQDTQDGQHGERKRNCDDIPTLVYHAANLVARNEDWKRAGAIDIGQVGVQIPLGAMSKSVSLASDLPEGFASPCFGKPRREP